MGLFFKKKPKSKSRTGKSVTEHRVLLQKYPTEIRRRAHRRKTSLVVHPNGKIVILCSLTTPEQDLGELLKTNEDWLKRNLKRAEDYQENFPRKKFETGEKFSVLGRDHSLLIRLSSSKRWRTRLDGSDMIVEVPTNFKQLFSQPEDLRMAGMEQLRKFYRNLGKKHLSERIAYLSHQTRLYPSKVSYRSQKTLWGSCNSKGHISLNWRLVAFPQEVIDYVITHELCHLVHPNHSRFFWELVGCHMHEYESPKKWLRDHQNSVDFLEI